MTPMTANIPETAPMLIGEEWVSPDDRDSTAVNNPATGERITQTPVGNHQDVDRAVRAAARAFPSWSGLPALRRADILYRYRALLEKNFESISRLISLENGKTLAEARGDIRRGLEVVEFACGIGQLSKGEHLPQVANHIDGVTMREPLGVCAGISPFNFPAMVPMWMFPLAIACGNTFVLKPSEKVPLTAIRLAELFLEAGLPEGVLNIVHGGKEVVDALCKHPEIAAISFVGSSRIAKYVYGLANQHGKRVQAGGAAKNALVVMPDAEPESTLRAIMGSAFGCAGQRCMAGSLLVSVGEVDPNFQHAVVEAMNDLQLGDPLADEQTGMGPVIDGASRDRIQNIIGTAENSGVKLVRDGRKNLPNTGFFVGPTLFEGVAPSMPLFREEIFGPVLSQVRPKNLEQAIQWLNQLNFGNGATLFTSSGGAARQFSRGIKCGMVGINVGVPAPMALFPFAGWNDSFYGDLHMQGTEGVQFYTRQKVVLSRWDHSYKSQSGW